VNLSVACLRNRRGGRRRLDLTRRFAILVWIWIGASASASLEREVADLVDDQQFVVLEPLELLVEGVAFLGGRPIVGRWRRRRGSCVGRP
jgi:hypothetical protein